MRNKITAVIFFALFLFSSLEVCAVETEVLIEGPEKMLKLAEPWADKFQQDDQGITIKVRERSEEDGFADLISGRCDIVISRTGPKNGLLAPPGEINKTAVAAEGVTFAVNPQNPVSKLTIRELQDILSGKIISWEEVGGVSAEITIYGPQANSWVNDFIKERSAGPSGIALATGIIYRVISLSSGEEIRQQVAADPRAIGYYPGVYAPAGLKVIAISGDNTSEYIYPVKEKMPDARYPLRRTLFFWTKGGSKPAVKRFLDRVLSKDYQEILSVYGVYPVTQDDQSNQNHTK